MKNLTAGFGGLLLVMIMLSSCGRWGSGGHNHDPYAGQQDREVASLSDRQMQRLRDGSGMVLGGLAKPAELNGYPGPRHVLDLGEELNLTRGQKEQVQEVYRSMKEQAQEVGREFVEEERKLDGLFARKTADSSSLREQLDESARVYAELRSVHLAAHLRTRRLLSDTQVRNYQKLRGYSK